MVVIVNRETTGKDAPAGKFEQELEQFLVHMETPVPS